MLRLAGSRAAGTVLWMEGEKTVRDRLNAFADAGATEFSAVEFCKTDAERENTRELLRSFL